jgi:RimJ/RimL family protein N-acetyltransferase
MAEVGLIAIDGQVAAGATDATAPFVTNRDVIADGVRDFMAGVVAMIPASMLERGPWGSFFAFDRTTSQIVGSCAYKAAPDAGRTVEIAYYTFPPFEGRGYATAMASALVARAQESGIVDRILAHTLPERNASACILERSGFRFEGEVHDPEDGPVWRWSL